MLQVARDAYTVWAKCSIFIARIVVHVARTVPGCVHSEGRSDSITTRYTKSNISRRPNT